MKKFLPTLILALVSFQGFSQGMIAPPSPNAQALARYASVPVNHYTGVPAINIPLYTLPGKELSVPISLSYHAGGNKVQDVASWVGLGWSLNAGGVITRVVRGLPDEEPNGYCGVNNIGEKAKEDLPVNSDSWQYLENVAKGDWDSEPDVFYFNFMGNAGRFIIDANGKAHTTPYRNVKISTGICNGGNTEWVITDENGTKYFFGSSSLYTEKSTAHFNPTDVPSDSYYYTSSWYLSKIESANSTDSIYFSYLSSSNIVNVNKTYRKYDFLGGDEEESCNKYNNETTESTTVTSTTISPKYVSSISSSFGSISFIPSAGKREDLEEGKILEKIIVEDKSNNVVKEFDLGYGYFSSDGCSDAKCKRLRLDNLKENSQPLAKLTYEETINLPARDSYDFDHWGFYSNVGGDIPGVKFEGVDHTEYNGMIFYGVNRGATPTFAEANILKSIKYPTGETVTFNYDPNQYFDPEDSQNHYAGGLRISAITNDPGFDQLPIVVNYKYNKFDTPTESSGLLYSIPKYWNMITIQQYGASRIYSGDYIERHSSVINNLYDLAGSHIGYSNVAEDNGLNEIRYSFYDLNDFSDSENQLLFWRGDVNGEDIETYEKPSNWEKAPEPIKNSNFWKRGQIKSRKVVDKNGNTISNEKYDYQFNTSIKKKITGVYLGPAGYLFSYGECGSTSLVQGSYFEISQPFYLTKQTTELYDQLTPNIKTTNVQEFIYNTEDQLSETKAYNLAQSSSKQIIKIKYVTDADYDWNGTQQCDSDYADCMDVADMDPELIGQCELDYYDCLGNPPVASSVTKAILNLRNKHAINTPVEKLSIMEEGGTQHLLGASYSKFKTQGTSDQMVVPLENYVMRDVVNYSGYTTSSIDANGNFVEPVVSGANYQLANSSVYSATSGLLTSQTDNEANVATYNYSDNILSSVALENDGLSTSESQVVTPLVGVMQKTDANGRKASYMYDKRQRLKYIKDNDGNVITRYHYNTPAAPEPTISANGDLLEDHTIQFSSCDPFDLGISTITWGFGDGTVLENSSEIVNHTFINPGTYDVSFTVTNPEYEAVSVTKTITIMSCAGILPYLCATPSYDLCTYTESAPWCSGSGTDGIIEVVEHNNLSDGSYTWQFDRMSGGTYIGEWVTLEDFTGSTLELAQEDFMNVPDSPPIVPERINIKCTTKNGCGIESTSYIEIYITNSGYCY